MSPHTNKKDESKMIFCTEKPTNSIQTVGKMFCGVLCISFPPGVNVGTLNFIASIPGPTSLTLMELNLQNNRHSIPSFC